MYGIDLTVLGSKASKASNIFLVNSQSEIISPVKNILYSVAAALPENEVFSKIFEQDTRRSDREILQILKAYFADFNQPLAIDFQRVGENKIAVLAAPEEKIKNIYNYIPEYLNITAIESEAVAIARALRKTGKITQSIFGFKYAENNKIKTYIFENNYLIYHGDDKLFNKFYPDFNLSNINILFLENKPYLLALGLALREQSDLNLLPWREASIKLAHKRGILFVIKAIIFSVVLSAVIHFFWNYIIQKNQLVMQSQNILSAGQKNQIHSLQNKLLQLNKLKDQSRLSIELLTNLSHAMPEGVFLTQLDFTNPAIQLSGQAVTQTQINTLMGNLKNIPFMQNPVLNNITADNSTPPYNFKFVISAEGKNNE